MKTSVLNRKIVVSVIVVILLIYGIQSTSYGQLGENPPVFTPVCDRTPQVRDAIVAIVPGVDDCKDVTAAHLALITNLNLSDQNITALKAGDLDGLTALNSLALYRNNLSQLPADLFSGLSSLNRLDLGNNALSSLPADLFSELSSLEWLSLSFNQLSSLPAGIFSGLSALRTLNLSYNKLSNLPADTFSELSLLNTLNLSSNQLRDLPTDIFSGLPSLNWLSLSFNELSSLPAGIFSEISSLRSFYLGNNAVNLSITVSLEQIEDNQFKAIVPTGAPFNIVLPLSVVNGAIDGGATTIEIPAGSVESQPLTVTRTPGTSDPIAVDIVILPALPTGHYGYSLLEPSAVEGDNSLIFALGIPRPNYEPNVNHAPIFIEGSSAMRSVAENTLAGVNIGGAVAATDEDDDILTYSLSGADAGSFGIVGTTGQLQTRAELDYETRNTYSVVVTVVDGRGGADTIGVVINVTNENEDPIFIEGDSTTRSVAENTSVGVNIGAPVSATDEDGDPLTYTLGGVDAASFGIIGTSGQLQTRAELDYETKDSYAVTILVSDGNGGTDTIGVAISVTDENDDPIFVEGDSTTRSVAENTGAGVNIGSPVSATDEDGDTLTYILAGVDAAAFGVAGSSGQLQTRTPLDYETEDAYSVTILVSDGNGGTDTIGVTISVTDKNEAIVPVIEGTVIPEVDETPQTHAPVFTGNRTTRSIAENTPSGVNIGSPVSGTDADNDTLTYTLGGVDAAAFGIVRSSGQLQTQAPLDYETKNAYTVTVTVSDGSRTDIIIVVITIIDVDETPQTHAPVFTGSQTTRSIAENTPSGVNIGSPVSATDADDDTLTYTLSGTDAAAFRIVSTTGQLKTHAPLDFEAKNAYTVTVSVSDGTHTDTIIVAIIIIDVDETPPTVDETPQPGTVGGEVSISEIMYGSEIRFTPKQWIEIFNAGTKPIDLTGWTLTVQNVDSEDLLGPQTLSIKFRDTTFEDAPRIWPNDFLLIVTSSSDDNSGGFMDDQIYDLRWIEGARKGSVDISFWTTWLSGEGFHITLTDKDGNLVDEAGNYDGSQTLWDLPYSFNRGRTRAGNRTSLMRRYVNGVARDGTQAASWVTAVDANLTTDQRTYYGDENDISSPGVGIIINDIASQFGEYDTNQDGVVNVLDLVFVAGRFGQSGPNNADVNGDGVVSILDLIKVASAINQEPAAPALHPDALSLLTAADIREWLIQAQGSDLTDPGWQKGIFFLQQLLSVLVPKETELLPNYPNPFNPETWIPYRLAEDGFVTLTIYDPRGHIVRRLDVGHQNASVYESRSKAIYWDGRNEGGDRVASGVYFYTLTAGDYSATRKMVILK